MKLIKSLCGIFLTACVLNANATNIDQIVVFGDSLSDNGNIFSLTERLHKVVTKVPVIPQNPPYYSGRFSNGPNWIDNLGALMNVPIFDYAYGGSWAEPFHDSRLTIPFGLGMQVDMYLVSAITDYNKDKHLYVIWSGGNDYVSGREDADYATTNAVASIKKEFEWLVYYGAKNVLILNLPDLGKIPEVTTQGEDLAVSVSALAQLHNDKLAAMLAELRQQYPDVNLVTVDTMAFFDDAIAQPAKYNLKNVTDSCYGGGYYLNHSVASLAKDPAIIAAKKSNLDILNSPALRTAYVTSKLVEEGQQSCDNPDEYLFWDKIHPTQHVHKIIAGKVLALLKQNNIEGIN